MSRFTNIGSHFVFEHCPIDTLLNTGVDQTSDIFTHLKHFLDAHLVDTDSKINKKDPITHRHQLLDSFSLREWVIVYERDFILVTILYTRDIHTKNRMKCLHVTRLGPSDNESGKLHLRSEEHTSELQS